MEPELGIRGYLTDTPGLGGSIKATPEDFVVSEVSLPPPRANGGPYSIATLTVRNWETNRLVRELARSLRISRRRIGFAGTKDKRAVSSRIFSFQDVRPESVRDLSLKDVTVDDVYPASSGVAIGHLIGNRFRIVLRGLTVPDDRAVQIVAETDRQLRSFRGFPNFFGVQRFGSIRPITHLVGRHLVRGEFGEAVRVYVAHPIEGEGEESHEVRRSFEASADAKAALRDYPKVFTFEKAILNHLVAYPDDAVGALRQLPFNLLLMFVHAYESYLFNRILSERLARGLPIHEPVPGDRVLPADRHGLPDRSRIIDVTLDNLAKVTERCRARKAWTSGILFGSEPLFAEGEPGEIEHAIVASEGLRPEDFIIPEIPRISSKGTRRELLAPLGDLDSRVADRTLVLSFELARGCYATSLLREFIKAP